MSITSSLRFLYILGGSGQLCADRRATPRQGKETICEMLAKPFIYHYNDTISNEQSLDFLIHQSEID